MRILVGALVYYPKILGGGEISTQLMCEGLAKRGHEVYVLCLGMEDKDEIINNVKVRRIYLPKASEIYCLNEEDNAIFSKVKLKFGDYLYNQKLYNSNTSYIKTIKPDLVHSTAHMSNMGRYNFWKAASDMKIPVSHVFRCPSLVERNSSIEILNRIKMVLNRNAIKLIDYFAAPSRYMLELNELLDSRIKTGTIIYNAVDFQNKPPLPKKKKMILYAGVLKEDKGLITLVKAYKRIKDDAYNLVMVGKGELKSYLQNEGVKVLDWMPR